MEKINDIWEALPIWDKVEALECLGIKLDLTDSEQIEIAGQKAKAEKEEELNNAKETKARSAEFAKSIMGGADYGEAVKKLFKRN